MATNQVPIVLVVEDEALIRMLAHETLSEVGMHVLEAAHGGEALDLLQARPDVSVIFSDVNMPVLWTAFRWRGLWRYAGPTSPF